MGFYDGIRRADMAASKQLVHAPTAPRFTPELTFGPPVLLLVTDRLAFTVNFQSVSSLYTPFACSATTH